MTLGLYTRYTYQYPVASLPHIINLYMKYPLTQPAGRKLAVFSISNTPTIAFERRIFKMQA